MTCIMLSWHDRRVAASNEIGRVVVRHGQELGTGPKTLSLVADRSL